MLKYFTSIGKENSDEINEQLILPLECCHIWNILLMTQICWKWNDQQIIEVFSIQRQNIIVWSFFTLRAILVNRVMYVITTLITVIHTQTLYMIFLILLTFFFKPCNAHMYLLKELLWGLVLKSERSYHKIPSLRVNSGWFLSTK